MILSKLYSSDPNFKSIEFNDGFNLIIAKVEKRNNNDTHGLGKTTIAKLIDYMLLKKLSSKFFLKENYDVFEDHIFFLEIKLNDGRYLTIKRGVKNNTKISFKILKERKQNLVKFNDWDEKDLNFDNAKKLLENYLNFDILKNYGYRDFLRYIIRTQDDYSNLFKTKHGKDKTWKPKLLELFGLNNEDYLKKIDFEEAKEVIKSKYSNVGDDYLADLEEKQQYLIDLDKELLNLKKQIDKFDYYEIDSEITREVADDVHTQISNLNRTRFNLQIDIKNIQDKLKKEISSIDIEDLEILFEEVNIYFGNSIKKDYSELVEFNKKISEERQEHLKKSLGKKEKIIGEVETELQRLNSRQSEILEALSRNDKVKKIIDHQKEFNRLEVHKGKLETEIHFLSEGRNQLKKVAEIDIKISKLKLRIQENLESKSEAQKSIILLLSGLSTSIFSNLRASLTISPNGAGNPEFSLKLRDRKTDKITSEDNGNHKNMFMVSIFDIALIITYLEDKFYRFIFHDGNIEASDHRLKKSYLETIKKYCAEYNFQYITTAIEDEIKDVKDIIEEKDIVLTLTDDEDHSGTLFGFKY